MFQNQQTVCCISSIVLYNETNQPTQPTEQQQKNSNTFSHRKFCILESSSVTPCTVLCQTALPVSQMTRFCRKWVEKITKLPQPLTGFWEPHITAKHSSFCTSFINTSVYLSNLRYTGWVLLARKLNAFLIKYSIT